MSTLITKEKNAKNAPSINLKATSYTIYFLFLNRLSN